MKKTVFRITGLLLVPMLFLSACQQRNPPLNSVITAHGNTDWHIDTAEEFLYGTEISGDTTAANHVPDTWTRRHMHTGLTNTNKYYYDKDKIASGLDNDATNGIETAMLFFYAGHGWPESFDTLNNSASMSNMSLADYNGGGFTRYYWQCSCEVFAHGPKACSGGGWDYSCPQDFNGSSDSDSHRNVFERWGPVLNDDLRMACGASTSAWCHEEQTDRIWDNYNNNGLDVADSFIDGLSMWGHVVPLCITKGGSDVSATPLYDTAFTNQPNTSGDTYYHIQYLSSFAKKPIHPIYEIEIPKLLPIYQVIPLPIPDPIIDYPFQEVEGWWVPPDDIDPIDPIYRINIASGAVYVNTPGLEDTKQTPLSEGAYLELAYKHADELGWLGDKTFSEPYGEAMMLVSQPVEGGARESVPVQKSVMVTFRRTLEVEGLTIPVLGNGGTIRIQMNNDGSLRNAGLVWREIDESVRGGVVREVETKSYERALEEALAQIKEAEAYVLDQWDWGYKEEAGNVKQTELHPVFQFTFVPRDPEMLLRYPPQLIEISGEME